MPSVINVNKMTRQRNAHRKITFRKIVEYLSRTVRTVDFLTWMLLIWQFSDYSLNMPKIEGRHIFEFFFFFYPKKKGCNWNQNLYGLGLICGGEKMWNYPTLIICIFDLSSNNIINCSVFNHYSIIQCIIQSFKGLVHFQITISLFTHPRVIQDVYVFLLSKEGFWWKHSRICIHIVHFNGLQLVNGQFNFQCSFKGL